MFLICKSLFQKTYCNWQYDRQDDLRWKKATIIVYTENKTNRMILEWFLSLNRNSIF